MRQMYNNGLIGILVIIIMAIITLSYFNVDLKSIADKPLTQQNINYVTTQTESLWKTHLEKPLTEIWNTVVVDGLWDKFIASMKEGAPVPQASEQPQVYVGNK